MTNRFIQRWWWLPLAAAALGCTPRDVVAEVGDERITRDDVRQLQKTNGGSAPEALDLLIARAQLAEAAKRSGLAKDPQVQARVHAAARELLAQAYVDRQLSAIDEKTARDYFDAHRSELSFRQLELGHIFIPLASNASPEETHQAESRANTAWAKLLGGAEFAEVAKELSGDVATKDKGGALGVVREGQVAQDLFEVAAALAPGHVSKPVRTPFGLHVLKLLGPVQKVEPSFDEAKSRLFGQLRHDEEAKVRATVAREIQVKRHPENLEEGKL